MADMDKNEIILGSIFWIIVLFIAYWYWHCSDGIRAVKTMTADEVIFEDFAKKAWGINDIEKLLKEEGINTKISFEDAIDKTDPSSIEYLKTTTSLLKRDGETKGVEVIINYKKPWKDITRLVITFVVAKKHFWNFNPSVVAPEEVTIVKGDVKKHYSLLSPHDAPYISGIIYGFFEK